MAMRINEGRRARRRSIAQALVSPKSKIHPARLAAIPLSKTAQEALKTIWRRGKLYRRLGGYWTYKNCPDITVQRGEHANLSLPSWYALTTTIREIVERGRARFVEDGEAIEYVPSRRDKADDTESA